MSERSGHIRILVCGGRDFADRDLVFRTLDALAHRTIIDAVIEGDARGADRIAGYWARKGRIKNLKFPILPAEWDAYGKSAGPIRNRRMLAEGRPDLVVAFPGGRGTADMVRAARAAGIDVLII